MGVKHTVTDDDVSKLYQYPYSLCKWLPWKEYSPDEQLFVLEDDLSVGLMFEVRPVAVEGKGSEFLKSVEQSLENLLGSTMPQDNPPWIMTTYAYDENDLQTLWDDHKSYVLSKSTDPRYQEFRDYYLEVMERHLTNITNVDGYFFDNEVTKLPWRGITRRVVVCIYRRLKSLDDLLPGCTPESEANNLYDALQSALADAGVTCQRMGNRELYDWLFPWFNDESLTKGERQRLLMEYPYPGDDNLPFGVEMNNLLFTKQVVSDVRKGVWKFGDCLHKAITVDNLRSIPVAGQTSAELTRGDKKFALVDKLPSHTMLVMTVVFVPKDDTVVHLTTVKNNSRGDHHEARVCLRQSEKTLEALAEGHNLFPTVITLLTKARDESELRRKSTEVQSVLTQGGFKFIHELNDLLPVNHYIRCLPFNYQYELDKDERRNRLVFSTHLARILPFYGRSRGTANPGLIFFNRGAEDIGLDLIADRRNNAFVNMIGPPGSGKSSSLNNMIWYYAAVHNARIFILEKGGSFEVTADLLRTKGLSVNQVTLKKGANIALSPFADAVTLAMIDVAEEESERDIALLEEDEKEHLYDFDEEDTKRDYLGEMELSARLMITGGERKEEDVLMRSDRVLIRNAIRRAGRHMLERIEQDKQHQMLETDKIVLPVHVVQEFEVMAGDETLSRDVRDSASRMARAMMLSCDGVAGEFFNKPGTNWEESDVTVLEFGILAGEGYEAEMALAFTSLMNRITYLVERDEGDARPTIVIADEAHLFLSNPLLAIYLVKIVKMYRKLGCWLTLATQSLDDYTEESNRLLSMFEWTIAMTPQKKEIEGLEKIRDLIPEQKNMLREARKQRGAYTEGVIMSDQFQALFRSVQPLEILALGLTEKEEKAERYRIMRERGITSKYEAALIMAQELMK